ncbi:MAG: hypothetical protein MI919_11345, partial [Holophagales bacterium]|nr:hypothetical protein [Holophagales bacterium]
MSESRAIAALSRLGFTELEARIYIYLTRHSPVTGYKVAKGIGATNASAYKALEALERKGAVDVAEGDSRLYRAVSAPELLGQIQASVEEECRKAADSLSRFEAAAADDRIYHLKNPQQVLARCRSMLESSRATVLVDAFPDALEKITPLLIEASGRGVQVIVQAYRPTILGEIQVVVHRQASEILERW